MSVNSDNLKIIDMDKEIDNEFKSFIPDLKLFLCVYHLEKRAKHKISDMNHEKDAFTSLLKDIYGHRYGGIHEVGLADAADENDFLAKVETLKPKIFKYYLAAVLYDVGTFILYSFLFIYIQWNLYKTDTLGEIESVRLIEVFQF